jgi:hypothetical protein
MNPLRWAVLEPQPSQFASGPQSILPLARIARPDFLSQKLITNG